MNSAVIALSAKDFRGRNCQVFIAQELSQGFPAEISLPDSSLPEISRVCSSFSEACEDGVTSPICRSTGFRVVVNHSGSYRAARMDMPHGRDERAIVVFEPSPFSREWIVTRPSVVSPDLRILSGNALESAKTFLATFCRATSQR
jgi:hypothetical protein